jgi:S1-C subfamily serine protease
VIGAYSADDATAELSGDRFDLFDAGEPILSLESDPGQLVVFDEGGEAVQVGLSDQETGQVILFNEGNQVISLEVTANGEGEVDVYGQKSGKPSVAMRSNGGTGLVAVTSSSGEVVSVMSVLGDGGGQVVVWNAGGQVPAVVMTRSPTSKGGLLQVSNDRLGVAFLAVGPGDAGQMQLHDATGNNMVEAGQGDIGVGLVRVGPNFECAGVKMGLANPNCLMGLLNK